MIGPVLDSVEALVERALKELEHLAGGATASSYSVLEVQLKTIFKKRQGCM